MSRRPPIVRCLLVLLCFSTAGETRVAAAPLITIDDARATEGSAGSATVVFKVHLSAPSMDLVTVDFQTADGTALEDSDYDPVAGTLVMPPGAVIGAIYVSVHGDSTLEGNEWFTLTLSNPVGATIADPIGHGVLVNDERTTFTLVGAPSSAYVYGTLPCAWGDYDGDGLPDLPLYDLQPYGGLTEIPGFRTLLQDGNYHGVAWCDYDRDGDPDLVLLGYSGVEGGSPTSSKLLRNDGPNGFVDVAPQFGMNIIGSGETAVWADFDGDGWPDLFTPYYSHVYPFQSFLYHNEGDGTFTEQAASAGVSMPNIPPELRPEGAHAADWNDDGHTDLYCASHLFLNDGTGHFTDVRATVGLPILFDEGASMVDYDNDGDLDLYLRGVDGPHLYRNDVGLFSEVTAAAGLEPVPVFWGDSFADVDADGDLDLLLVVGDGTLRLMLNQSDGTFLRDTDFDQLLIAPDLAVWGDIDLDGDEDFVLGGNNPTKRIYRNRIDQNPGYAGSHLAVRVLDAAGLETAFGATVRLRAIGGPAGTTQTRVVDGGSGFLGQGDYPVHFGGLGTGRYALEVVFPSPAGTRVVVDSTANPELGRLEPSAMVPCIVTVYRDARVEFSGTQAVAGVPSRRDAPSTDRLGLPRPSPASRTLLLPLVLEKPGRATVTIHDLAGRRVRSIDVGHVAGRVDVTWDLSDASGAALPSGVYLARLHVDGRPAMTRRLLVVR